MELAPDKPDSIAPDQLLAEQRRLRSLLLDRGAAESSRELRSLAAEMLLSLDDEPNLWRVAVDWLRDSLAIDRVDGGPGNPADGLYRMGYAEAFRSGSGLPSVADSSLEWRHPLMAELGASKVALVYPDFARHALVDADVRSIFVRLRTGSKVAMAISDSSGVIGLVCADRILELAPWRDGDLSLLETSVRAVMAPILRAAALLRHGESRPSRFDSLSKAERKVLHFAAQGLSYKEVARSLGRSPSTVDHQLRSIRAKLDVGTNRRLLTLLAELAPQERRSLVEVDWKTPSAPGIGARLTH